jgi:hypothetical protein
LDHHFGKLAKPCFDRYGVFTPYAHAEFHRSLHIGLEALDQKYSPGGLGVMAQTFRLNLTFERS